MMGYGFIGMFLIGGLFLLFLVGAVALVAWLLSRARPSGGGQSHSTARQILDERLARGEISREEYDALRAKIGSYGRPPRGASHKFLG